MRENSECSLILDERFMYHVLKFMYHVLKFMYHAKIL